MTNPAQEKPHGCRVYCGGTVPDPPPHMPNAQPYYRCGISTFGNCPTLKSIVRARSKRARRLHGLWRRSRRDYRQRLQAMAILLDFPTSAARWPEGTQELVRQRAKHIAFQPQLYYELRQNLDLQEAVNEYLNIRIPFSPK